LPPFKATLRGGAHRRAGISDFENLGTAFLAVLTGIFNLWHGYPCLRWRSSAGRCSRLSNGLQSRDIRIKTHL